MGAPTKPCFVDCGGAAEFGDDVERVESYGLRDSVRIKAAGKKVAKGETTD